MRTSEFKFLATIQSITLILVLILLVDRYYQKSSPRDVNEGIALSTDVGTETVAIGVNADNDFVYGNLRAPNTMFIFSRYNCDYCRQFYAVVLDSLLNGPVKDGRLKIVSKNFVRLDDQVGMLMAKTTEAARQMGKYEQVHNALIQAPLSYDSTEIVNIAINAGLEKDTYLKLLNAPQTIDKILNDRKLGESIHIQATPSLYINGVLNTGYMNYDLILDYINL
ncbi:MAG: thioredoxin domain-containing protein [Chitinophagaceae bacterium]|nr:thioredoxin domain-containing protein [Chitinophagaceae bacterium]